MNDHDYAKPLPDVDDPDMAPFWAAARDERLTAQRCRSCARLRFPATPICGHCLSEDTEWVGVAATGVVWSYVVYHRAFHPGFADELPYAVAIVENDDGLHYVGTLLGDRDAMQVGARVRAVFDAVTSEVTLVKWQVQP